MKFAAPDLSLYILQLLIHLLRIIVLLLIHTEQPKLSVIKMIAIDSAFFLNSSAFFICLNTLKQDCFFFLKNKIKTCSMKNELKGLYYNKSMNKRLFPDVFQFQLRQKYHSAKLHEIRLRKTDREQKQQLNRYNSKKTLPFSLEQRAIAMQNLELVKRLAQVKYKPAEISKFWSQSKKKETKRKLSKPHTNILHERQRLVQNERLGKSIQIISKRRKKMILPD